ncbi:SAF domain-containing protein [Nocardia jejuensis]|uniref:SAF domain-containing protein n=1 Tax=Nocardia jejuensis TaxID=328049 RepID=UPI000836A0C3|nr:SAF domain-containing protein [Nocardia jejuensis]
MSRLRGGTGGNSELGRGSRIEFLARLRPTWADAVLLRRVTAVALLVIAAFSAFHDTSSDDRIQVLVAVRDLPPGLTLGLDDVRSASRESATLPAGAVREPDRLRGATLSGAVAAGEILTDLRVVGPRLAALAAGAPDARIVPIRLADNAVADILRAGDRVDVVAAAEPGADGRPARLLASDAAVVLVPEARNPRDQGERVVLVALDSRHATAVAAASLHAVLTVTFR